MAQNNSNNNNTGGSSSQPSMGSTGSTGTDASRLSPGAGAVTTGDTDQIRGADTDFRTTGSARNQQFGNQQFGSTETSNYNEARTSFQPQRSEVTLTEQRTTSRPSTKAVIGSAAAAALVGGAIPFMLSARKSRQSEDVSFQRRGTTVNSGASYGANSGPSYRESSGPNSGTSYGESELADDRTSPRGRR
ncbi:MAG TPA: hypothetical protein VEZ41_15455 [Allosphingosinicella sp.]|jgi:hypothetical protein|nr:hypothetical protein [Allosphingosinicella sp.]